MGGHSRDNAAAAAVALGAVHRVVLDAEHARVFVRRNKCCVRLGRLVGRHVAGFAWRVAGLDEHRTVRRARSVRGGAAIRAVDEGHRAFLDRDDDYAWMVMPATAAARCDVDLLDADVDGILGLELHPVAVDVDRVWPLRLRDEVRRGEPEVRGRGDGDGYHQPTDGESDGRRNDPFASVVHGTPPRCERRVATPATVVPPLLVYASILCRVSGHVNPVRRSCESPPRVATGRRAIACVAEPPLSRSPDGRRLSNWRARYCCGRSVLSRATRPLAPCAKRMPADSGETLSGEIVEALRLRSPGAKENR